MQANDTTSTARSCQRCGTLFRPRPGDPGLFCSRECYFQVRRERSEQDREDRFWSAVDTSNPDGCWLWTRSKLPTGYGQFPIRHGRSIPAHVFAWMVATGATKIPSGQMVCHVCDVRACVRNDDVGQYSVRGVTYERRGHLFLATHTANVHDMLDKGRQGPNRTQGIRNGRAKLTDAEVITIRDMARTGVTQDALAERFGISQSAVSFIVLRQSWRHLP